MFAVYSQTRKPKACKLQVCRRTLRSPSLLPAEGGSPEAGARSNLVRLRHGKDAEEFLHAADGPGRRHETQRETESEREAPVAQSSSPKP